MTEIQ